MKKLPDPDGSIKQNVFQARQWEKQGWRYFQGVPDEVLEENWYITHSCAASFGFLLFAH